MIVVGTPAITLTPKSAMIEAVSSTLVPPPMGSCSTPNGDSSSDFVMKRNEP
jgi:hypothetical protein